MPLRLTSVAALAAALTIAGCLAGTEEAPTATPAADASAPTQGLPAEPVTVAEDFEMLFGTAQPEVLVAIVPMSIEARNATAVLAEMSWDDALTDLDVTISGPDVVEFDGGAPGSPDGPLRHVFSTGTVEGDYVFRITSKAPGFTAVHLRLTAFFDGLPPEGFTAL